jgi:hypothetical protein
MYHSDTTVSARRQSFHAKTLQTLDGRQSVKDTAFSLR